MFIENTIEFFTKELERQTRLEKKRQAKLLKGMGLKKFKPRGNYDNLNKETNCHRGTSQD
jgi:hypothetical protein